MYIDMLSDSFIVVNLLGVYYDSWLNSIVFMQVIRYTSHIPIGVCY